MWHLVWIAALLLIAFARRRRARPGPGPGRRAPPGSDEAQRELQRLASSNKPYPGS